MNKEQPYRLIVSGGGTGGHIYPALAIADQFKSEFPSAEILFIGASDRMEMTKVPQAGYPIEGLWIAGIQRSLSLKNLMFPIKLVWSIFKANRIIKNFKPHAVIGTGGFASGPTVIAASRKGIPVLLQEQNSYPGLTNRQMSKYAKKVCVAYDDMERFFQQDKLILTGNPVRGAITQNHSLKAEGLAYFGLKENKTTLLVLGGSLGARTINDALKHDIDTILDAGIQVIWQTGKFYFDELMQTVPQKEGLHMTQFIDRMDLAYNSADVVVSRAGALSVSELCLTALPVIFVPSPNVAEDHQRKNAESLVNKSAAKMIADKDAIEHLGQAIIQLANDAGERDRLSKNILSLAKPNATTDIVNELKSMLN